MLKISTAENNQNSQQEWKIWMYEFKDYWQNKQKTA